MMKDFLQSAILLCCGVFGLVLIVGTNREQILGEEISNDAAPIIIRSYTAPDVLDQEVWHVVKTEKLTIANDSLQIAGK